MKFRLYLCQIHKQSLGNAVCVRIKYRREFDIPHSDGLGFGSQNPALTPRCKKRRQYP